MKKSKRAAPNTAKKKPIPRRVTIPVGKDYVLFGTGQKVYVCGVDGTMPEALQDEITLREDTAYYKGYKEAQNQDLSKVAQGVQESPEELIKSILPRIRTQDVKDQNRIVAILLSELQIDRENFMDHLQKQHDQAQERLGMAKANYEGFIAVRNGGFENLNFR